ncbi:MAG: TonB-dependent receptor [Bacteroidales bacterium]|nr:TonB-dependent receptor [Bacteroidales bacterium]
MVNRLLFILLLFVSLVYSFGAYSQERMQGRGSANFDMSNFAGAIRGQVVDSLSQVGVEFANVALYRQRDSSLVTGTMTDEKGNFVIDKVTPGRFYLVVKFIGFKTRVYSGVAVSPRNPQVNVGGISILPASENIDAVVVTGEKRMLQYNLDKKIVNVDKDIATQGGTALDVLQNVPSVDVDNDGNVSLRGSTNVNILLDGRPSNLTSLDELPAQMMESVEIITNPSARYDPDGISGIINIVLKKEKEPGYNGMVSIMAGTGDKYNGSVSLNWYRDKVNVFANYNFRKMRMETFSNTNRVTVVGEDSTLLDQDQDGLRNGFFNNVRAGVDYSLNSKNTISLSGTLNLRDFEGDNYTLSTTNLTTSESRRSTISNNDNIGKELALNYKRTFDKPGMELTADVFYSRRDGDDKSDINEVNIKNLVTSYLSERSITDSWTNTVTFQTDFVTPIGNGGRLESGLKGMVRSSSADYRYETFDASAWNLDLTRSNHFVYDEQIYAAYGIYSNTFGNGKYSYQLGVRVEDQITKSTQRATGEVFDTSRVNLFPSAHIRWEPNSINSFQVSYSRRVNRPWSSTLNPFLNTSDRYNWSRGNPYLEPEFTSSLDFSYSMNYPKTKVSASVFYRDTRNGFSRKVQTVDSVTTLSTYINLSHNESVGIEGVITQNITKWWRLNANYSYFYTKLHGDVVQDANEGKAWTAKFTSLFTIAKGIDIQVNGNYRSPVISAGGSGRGFHMMGGGAQGETQEMYWFDLGAKINVLKNKGTISLRVSDIFKTQTYKTKTWDTNFSSYSEMGRESRVFFVGFSYKLNNYKMKREKTSDSDEFVDDFE